MNKEVFTKMINKLTKDEYKKLVKDMCEFFEELDNTKEPTKTHLRLVTDNRR